MRFLRLRSKTLNRLPSPRSSRVQKQDQTGEGGGSDVACQPFKSSSVQSFAWKSVFFLSATVYLLRDTNRLLLELLVKSFCITKITIRMII